MIGVFGSFFLILEVYIVVGFYCICELVDMIFSEVNIVKDEW